MTPLDWRLSRKLSQAQVAEALGVQKSFVSKIERGAALPGPRVVRAYFEISAGQVTAADLFGQAAALTRDGEAQAA